jgi:hypothetical protein
MPAANGSSNRINLNKPINFFIQNIQVIASLDLSGCGNLNINE